MTGFWMHLCGMSVTWYCNCSWHYTSNLSLQKFQSSSKLLLHEAPWSKNHLQVQVYVPRRLKLKSRTLCTFSQLTDLSMKGCGRMTNQLLWSYENLNLQTIWDVLRYFVISKGDISTKDLPRKYISGLAFVLLVCLYYRSSHQRRCSLTKAVLRHFTKLAGNHLS